MTCGICKSCGQIEHKGPIIDDGYGYKECKSCNKIIERYAPL